MQNNPLYLSWRSPDEHNWYVVGRLSERLEGGFAFEYTKGALKHPKFQAFSGMPNLNSLYISEKLFPLFSNRLLPASRPEYPRLLNWLGLDKDSASPLAVLGRSEGVRSTDELQTFIRLEPDPLTGSFDYVFFVHGLAHLNTNAKQRVEQLTVNEQLQFCLDCQNKHDGQAVILRTSNSPEIIGFLPRYLCKSLSILLHAQPQNVTVKVEKLSSEAPSRYKLLCRMKGQVIPELHNAFTFDEDYEPINSVSHQWLNTG